MIERRIYIKGELIFKGFVVFKKYNELCEIHGEDNVEIR